MTGPVVESASPLAMAALTCFGKVLSVVTEILEEGDALAPRVVPPRCLQKHHLHTSSIFQTGTEGLVLKRGS